MNEKVTLTLYVGAFHAVDGEDTRIAENRFKLYSNRSERMYEMSRLVFRDYMPNLSWGRCISTVGEGLVVEIIQPTNLLKEGWHQAINDPRQVKLLQDFIRCMHSWGVCDEDQVWEWTVTVPM
jgi:hypothetical protein